MKKVMAVLLLLVWTATLLTACGADPLVGTWQATINGSEGQMTLNKDGTGEVVSDGITRPCTWEVTDDQLTVTQDLGDHEYILFDRVTYVIDGDTLTITSKSGNTLTFTKAE